MSSSLKRSFYDAVDILRHVRNPLELGKAVLPLSWVEPKVLNPRPPKEAEVVSAEDVAKALRKLKNKIKGELLSDDGKVAYAGIRETEAYKALEDTASMLHQVDPAALEGDAERIAFWTNLYNVLAIHGVGAMGIRDSVMEKPSFFRTVAYQVGRHTYTLDEMENAVLRRNAIPPASGSPLWSADDPRLATCPSYVEPRIHAALVCASTSCPPVSFYTADALDAQLALASENYVAADVHLLDEQKIVSVPITFHYYRDDFGHEEGIKDFILEHAADKSEAYRQAFASGYRLEYQRYDWSLNRL